MTIYRKDLDKRASKDLDKRACKEFVCPNLSLIDEGCRELILGDKTIKRARELAIEYFKKTYREPRYLSVKPLLPAFVYIASILEDERRTQLDIENTFGTSRVTITKWYRDITNVLNIKVINGVGIMIMSDQTVVYSNGRECKADNVMDNVDDENKVDNDNDKDDADNE